jgi:hypothetical protein
MLPYFDLSALACFLCVNAVLSTRTNFWCVNVAILRFVNVEVVFLSVICIMLLQEKGQKSAKSLKNKEKWFVTD